MKNSFNYQLEMYRGTIKQIMKVRRLRTISLYNYAEISNDSWLMIKLKHLNVHSVKLDIMSGYIDLYEIGTNGKCGKKIVDATTGMYKIVDNIIKSIIASEDEMHYKIRRKILVGVYR